MPPVVHPPSRLCGREGSGQSQATVRGAPTEAVLSARRSAATRAQWMRGRLANLASHGRGLAVAAGLAKYKPWLTPDVADWSDRYESGGWDYLEGIHQMYQYSILSGYIAFLESRYILDVGCGTGLLRARMTGIPFHRYVGIDPVAVAIERAERLADERTEFVVGDVFLPSLGQFDAVVCNEVLYCVPEPEALLDRTQELVRAGGHFLTSNMRHPGDMGLYRVLGERFELVAAVNVMNDSERGKRRRRIALYKKAEQEVPGETSSSSS